LAALVYVETVSAHGEVETTDEDWSDMGVETTAIALPKATVSIPFAPTVAAVTDSSAIETETEIQTFEVLAPTLVVVPDLTGMRLRTARRELRALGLRMRVRDSYNDTIPRDYWSEYKVRKQRIEPGTEVIPGAKIRLVARERYRVSQGY